MICYITFNYCYITVFTVTLQFALKNLVSKVFFLHTAAFLKFYSLLFSQASMNNSRDKFILGEKRYASLFLKDLKEINIDHSEKLFAKCNNSNEA